MSDTYFSDSSKQICSRDQQSRCDEEFVDIMLEIEANYADFNRHDKVRVEQWTKTFCQVTTNLIWKQNRNLYAKLLLQAIYHRELFEPFNKMPPENLPTLNRQIVLNRLAELQKELGTKSQHQRITRRNSSRYSRQRSQSATRERSPYYSLIQNARKNERNNTEKSPSARSRSSSTSQLNKLIPKSIGEASLASKTPEKNNQSLSAKKVFNLDNEDTRKVETQKSPSTNNDRKQLNKLKSELELSRLNEESLKNDLNMKTLIINQLSRKLEKKNEDFHKIRDEYIKLKAFFRLTKKYVEEKSIQFVEKLEGKAFIRELEKLSLSFDWTSATSGKKTRSKSPDGLRALSPDASTDFERLTRLNGNIGILTENNRNSRPFNQLSDTKSKKSMASPNENSFYRNKFLGTGSKEYIGDQTTQELEPIYDYIKRNNDRSSREASPDPKQLKYSQIRSKLQVTDKETSDFLSYLEKFQKESEKLKRETEELLDKSNRMHLQNPRMI